MMLLKTAVLLAALSGSAMAQERAPNHLLGEDSPYLQQHLYNAVDWYPWGTQALAKARAENKPIFVSVGYASCHWCHVMEQESFENENIGAFMNAHFVAIKIDRERRPDLDEQFMLVTETLTDSGGWPNSVFLTPDTDPLFAGTYFPPDVFLDVITQVSAAWIEDPATLSANARQLSGLLQQYMNRAAPAQELSDDALFTAARAILGEYDEFNGGFGVAPKFPEESIFLFLLDQAQRDGDRKVLDAVLGTLDGMIRGGIHDQVGGGFHRYTVDPDWMIPHFEKMLYNQAQIGRLLVRAWQITGAPRYRRAAERTFDYVLRDLRDPQGGFYAAEDADAFGADNALLEGAFYTWTAAEIKSAVGDDSDHMIAAFNLATAPDIDGRSVLGLAATDPRIDRALALMATARALRTRPRLDHKIIAAWNGEMIATLAEASAAFARPDYLEAAKAAARFVLAALDTDNGLERISLDGRTGVDAQLPDYAALGLGYLALHDFAHDREEAAFWIGHARRMADVLDSQFALEDGTYRMTAGVDALGAYRPVADKEIASGNALALALFSGLARRVENRKYLRDARQLAGALSGHALESPANSAAILAVAREAVFGRSGPVRYVSGGAVRIATDYNRGAGRFDLDIQLRKGWHINAHEPLEDYLIPTDLTIGGKQAPATIYPKPDVKSLSFNAVPLALHEGNLTLSADVPDHGGKPLVVKLSIQACSDSICLPPEVLHFTLW